MKYNTRLRIILVLAVIILILALVLAPRFMTQPPESGVAPEDTIQLWHGPDSSTLTRADNAALIAYGRELIANTSAYLGPQGSVMHLTNSLNCQNCHLEAGTKPWGNNYGGVYSMYPKMRARSGTVEDINKRINDCILRSLDGREELDTNSHELKAIYAYMKWLGSNVPPKVKPAGAGITTLKPMDRAADTAKGRLVFVAKCQRCHAPNGQGYHFKDSPLYEYPPLWGPESYTTAAGLYRLSRFAGYVKSNMPFGVRYDSTDLSDEEAWDVAAYVNTQPRPVKTFPKDWPDLSKKPFDHPFGPYTDSFPEKQHKYGPYAPIIAAQKNAKD